MLSFLNGIVQGPVRILVSHVSPSLLVYSFLVAITKALRVGIMGPGLLLVTAEKISIVSKWRLPAALWLCTIASYQKLPTPKHTV